MLTLRQEILVVSSYEENKIRGSELANRVMRLRYALNDLRRIVRDRFIVTLEDLVEEGSLNPWHWLPAKKKLVGVDSLEHYDLMSKLRYGLTYRGYQEHLKIEDQLVAWRSGVKGLILAKQGRP